MACGDLICPMLSTTDLCRLGLGCALFKVPCETDSYWKALSVYNTSDIFPSKQREHDYQDLGFLFFFEAFPNGKSSGKW